MLKSTILTIVSGIVGGLVSLYIYDYKNEKDLRSETACFILDKIDYNKKGLSKLADTNLENKDGINEKITDINLIYINDNIIEKLALSDINIPADLIAYQEAFFKVKLNIDPLSKSKKLSSTELDNLMEAKVHFMKISNQFSNNIKPYCDR